MKTKIIQKALASSIGVIVAVMLFFSPGLLLPVLDEKTDSFFQESITKAGIAYATCRVINASVSIIKESKLMLEPAGVGVSLAVGQALDPIDDMTERLSDVLVTAITSLGVQKLAYEISVSTAPPIVAVFLFVLSTLIWFDNERITALQKTMIRFILLIAIARFCLPLSTIANEFVHEHYFLEKISTANKELAVGSAELDKLKDVSLPEIDGVLGTIQNSSAFLKSKTTEFKNVLVYTVSNAGKIIENLLNLTFLYVGIFLIQVIIFPLLTFWFMAKAANALFNTSIPVVVRHLQPQEEGVS